MTFPDAHGLHALEVELPQGAPGGVALRIEHLGLEPHEHRRLHGAPPVLAPMPRLRGLPRGERAALVEVDGLSWRFCRGGKPPQTRAK